LAGAQRLGAFEAGFEHRRGELDVAFGDAFDELRAQVNGGFQLVFDLVKHGGSRRVWALGRWFVQCTNRGATIGAVFPQCNKNLCSAQTHYWPPLSSLPLPGISTDFQNLLYCFVSSLTTGSGLTLMACLTVPVMALRCSSSV